MHARWIVGVTLVAVCAAAALALSGTPAYESQATVVVEPAAGSGSPPDMATEEGIVSSDAVLGAASLSLHVPISTLASGLSMEVPGTTSLLQIGYSDPDPGIAQQRAQAIAQAYVSYRSSSPAVSPITNPAGSAPVTTAPSAALITSASLPTSPAGPDYKIDIGAALIVGLALAIGSAGLRDYLDDCLRGSLDLEARAAAPVLAVIPAFPAQPGKPYDRLVMVTSPDSVIAEAYRGLRTQLVRAATSKNAKTLAVTSPAWEDKSTVAANLATVLAQSGQRVVLLCADLRWGRAHELFGLPAGDGLAGYLDGRTSLICGFEPTGIAGLRVLPPGAVPADPGALLQRPAWRTVLSDARRHADVVVIEAPPILASPDVGPIADSVEMVLVVADARRSTRTQVQVAMRNAEQVRGNLVGCVLDNVGRPRHLGSLRLGPVVSDRLLAARRLWRRLASRFGTLRTATPSGQDGPAVQHAASSGVAVDDHVSVTAARHDGSP